MKGTEKQIKYAEELREQFVTPLVECIDTQRRMVNQYRMRLERDPARYAAKITEREAYIERLTANLGALNDALDSIDSASEMIDAIKYGRPSLYELRSF